MQLEEVASYFPSVRRFEKGLSFKEKIKWVLMFLSIYFFLLNIPLVGVGMYYQAQNPLTILYSTLTGARIGSLATLGIAPIITASMIVQLLVASQIINWNIREIEGRKKARALEILLAYVFIIIEALVFTFYSRHLLPIKKGSELIIFVQIVIGGILVYLISDALDRIGFGSGVTLIILSGIVSSFFINLLSPFAISKEGRYIFWFQEDNAYPVGKLISLFVAMYRGEYEIFIMNLIPLISTIFLILVTILIFRSVIEIPLVHFQLRGFGRPIEFSLFYTSTLPLILGSALLANLNLMFSASATVYVGNLRCGIFGCFDENNNVVSGIAYYLSPPRALIFDVLGIRTTTEELNLQKEITRLIVFFVIFTIILAAFSWIWANSSGMDSQSIAENLSYYGFGISGYRVDERIIKDVLDRYIPYLIILSGILASILSIIIDIFGSVLASTSLIILVSASYSYYLLIKREKSENMPNIIRSLLE